MLQAKYPDLVLCEVPYCNEPARDPHEPLTRARGGNITDPENCRAICRHQMRELLLRGKGGSKASPGKSSRSRAA